MPQLKVQNFYSTALTSDIVGTGDASFTVTIAPTFTSGFLVISPNNTSLREIVYFHNVVGNTVSVRAENRGQGGTTAKSHTSSEPVAMKDIAEIFNMFSDSISQCFFVEKTGGLTIKVWGGTVFYNGNPVTVADTSLTLADNQTNYIKYSYPTNTISVDAINSGNIKARVTTVSGTITSIQYYVAKESYIDFTVTITGALPSQTGNSGKVLTTDGTNILWKFNIGNKGINLASDATVDIGNQSGANYFHITGTTTITSFGTVTAGTQITLVFDGILTLTHNVTSLILPTSANIITAVGDSTIFESEGGGNWKCVSYTRADGSALVAPQNPIQSLDKDFVLDENMTAGELGYLTATGVAKWVGEIGTTASYTSTTRQIAALSTTTGVAISSTGTAYNITAFTRSGITTTVGSLTLLKTVTPNTAIYGVVALNSTTFVALYGDNSVSPVLYARAGTVSGTTITLGSEVTIDTGASRQFGQDAWCKVDTDRFAVGFVGTGSARQIVCGSVSGTTISMGSFVSNTNAGSYNAVNLKLSYVAPGKIFEVGDNGGGTSDVSCIATMSGTVVTVQAQVGLPLSGGFTTINTYLTPIGNSFVGFASVKSATNYVWIANCTGTSASFGTQVTQSTGTAIGVKANDITSGLYFTVFTASGALNYFVSGTTPILTGTQNLYTSANHLLTDSMTNGIFCICISGSGIYVVNASRSAIIGNIVTTGTLGQTKSFNLIGVQGNSKTTLTPRLSAYLSSNGDITNSGGVKIGPSIGINTFLYNSTF